MHKAVMVLVLLLLTGVTAAAQTAPLEIPSTATEVVTPDETPVLPPELPAAQAQLAYSIIIENRSGGIVRMVEPPAQFLLYRPGIDLGTVLEPAGELELRPLNGTVGARQQIVETSAVDVLQLRLFADVVSGQAGYINLLPQERRFAAVDGSFETPSAATVYLDIKAGYGIFGGAYPLIAGNPVTAYRLLQHAELDGEHTTLTADDMFIIEVRGPAEWPISLELGNQPGAQAQLELGGGGVKCGFTTQALSGPFPLAAYPAAQPGRIASAGGALVQVACLPAAQLSALEIAPLGYRAGEVAPSAAQRALIADPQGYSPAGQPPLFAGYLYPLSGLETPRRLPQLNAGVRLNGSGTWLPLADVVVPEALMQIDGLRFSWAEYDPQQAAAEQPEPEPEPGVPGPPPENLPGFRLGESG